MIIYGRDGAVTFTPQTDDERITLELMTARLRVDYPERRSDGTPVVAAADPATVRERMAELFETR